jgi:hypothetical protein
MEIRTAQQEVRSVYINGAVGQAVSGLIWLISTALSTWGNMYYGMLALILGGVFIFPLTQLVLKMMGRRATLSRENPFTQLAMQVAFIVPLLIPVIWAAARANASWFYPAFMIVVGAHYLPFMTLYGMWQYAVLAAVLIGGGVGLIMLLPGSFTPGGWLTSAALFAFAAYAALTYQRERSKPQVKP